MNKSDFTAAFKKLTGNDPFPWQQALYERFIAGDIPGSCNLPTGLGKTSVVAVWLLALATRPDRIPRRLVYVVNRRTVVDQTTAEAEKLRENAKAAGVQVPEISTLRGQFADNRKWSADPSRPAVIVGTVDMIGSRLLFSGYGIGFKTRPLHAGFLGQDALLVHDEAHLEKPFQELLEAIDREQHHGRTPDFRPLKVMALTATPHSNENPFVLTDAERNPPEVVPDDDEPLHVAWRRLRARKKLELVPVGDEKQIVPKIIELAHKRGQEFPNSRVIIFVRTVEAVTEVQNGLRAKKVPEKNITALTGTLRGLERDRQANPRDENGDPVFARFLKTPKPGEKPWKVTPQPGSVYLICTAAGEVGVDISADHLVCDLTPFDSMAQRFGRVNRYGIGDSHIDVVHEAKPNEKKKDDPFDQRRWLSLGQLAALKADASPHAIGQLPLEDRIAAFTPTPTVLPVSDILFDAWALTTIRDKLPGRPLVEPYLHGIAEWEPPETHVAWRQEVDELLLEFADDDTANDKRKKRKAFEKFAAEVLDDYSVEPIELLREPSHRAFKHLAALAERDPLLPVWLLDDDGTVQVLTLGNLADKNQKDRINGMTVLLPPSAGGLAGGRLDGTAKHDKDRKDYDVADEWAGPGGEQMRRRVWEAKPVEKGWRLVRSIEIGETEDGEPRKVWRWLVRRTATDEAGATGQAGPYPLDQHNADAGEIAAELVGRLKLPHGEATAVRVAAGAHDLGKDRDTWQRSIGNGPPKPRLAKSGHRRPPEQVTHYRHEFGSLLDVPEVQGFKDLSPDLKELALHLIAAHHGRGRPHFPAEEAFDPERPQSNMSRLAGEIPRRFARLQRQYGRWGLAYLESLVRSADVLASKKAEGGGS